ncbi:MAG: hypothetical protein ABIP77_06340 [Candidatus Limnocylindrales bacterium]
MTGSTRLQRILPLFVISTALLGTAVAPPVVVLAHAPDPEFSGALWAQNQQLSFRWRSSAEPPAVMKTAILNGAADSNATRAARAATFAYEVTGASPVGYGLSAACSVAGLACFTRTAPDGGFTMWFREQGHAFDWGSLRWCQMYSTAPDGCYDVETVALDEFGHVQILNHHANFGDESDYLDAVVQTKSRTKPNAGWNMHTYGRCDTATLQKRYDMQTWSAKYSRCLSVNTTLTLVAYPTSVPSGESARLTASLKVAVNDAYGRLSGNPVSNRTVTLQRRPAGSSTWTSIGAMPAISTAGVYAMSVPLTYRTEFRAIFTKPAGEGLNGTTSPIVTVVVTCTTLPCPI